MLSRHLEQLIADDLQVRRVDARAAPGLLGEAREQDIVDEVFIIINPEVRLLQRPQHGFASFGLAQWQQIDAIGFVEELRDLLLEFASQLAEELAAEGKDETQILRLA